jgi:hypothetical protein
MGHKCFALVSVGIPVLASVSTSLVVPIVDAIYAVYAIYAISDVVSPVMAIGFVMAATGFMMVHYQPAGTAEFALLTFGIELPRPVSTSKDLAGVVVEIVVGAVDGQYTITPTVVRVAMYDVRTVYVRDYISLRLLVISRNISPWLKDSSGTSDPVQVVG